MRRIVRICEEESLLRIGEALLVLFTVVSLLSHLWLPPVYALDLLSHFQLQYTLVAFFAGIYYFVSRRILGTLCAGLLFISSLIHVIPYFGMLEVADATNSKQPLFRLMSANVYKYNEDYSSLRKHFLSVDPDCAVILEVDNGWATGLRDTSSLFPYSYFYPREEDGYGLALLCKKEPTAYFLGPLKSGLSPVVIAEFSHSVGVFRVVGVHAHNPVYPSDWSTRQKEFSELARYVRSSEVPVVLAGDFNATNWSPGFKEFTRDAGLSDPRLRFGLLLSWKGPLPFNVLPIDHVLPGSRVHVESLESIELKGSDHTAVVANLALTD